MSVWHWEFKWFTHNNNNNSLHVVSVNEFFLSKDCCCCCVVLYYIHRPRISNGYGNWRRVNYWIHIYTLSIRSIYSQKYMKRVERKDFSLDSRISLEPQNPPIGAMTFEKKITEWKKSLDRLENVYFRNRYTRRARWNIDNNKKNEEGIHTYNYQG